MAYSVVPNEILKQISLVNTCRRTVSQICLGFQGYITCTSRLNSNQGSIFSAKLEGKVRSLNVKSG